MTEEEKKCELKDGDISDAVIDKIDEYFPKGKNKDRGKVLCLIAAMQYEKKQALTAQKAEHEAEIKLINEDSDKFLKECLDELKIHHEDEKKQIRQKIQEEFDIHDSKHGNFLHSWKQFWEKHGVAL